MDQKTAQTIAEKTKQYLNDGCHCSEGVLLAVGEHYLGKVEPLALRMSTPFAGGVGRTHEELCGALAGGIMLIGALYGRSVPQVNDERCQALAKEFRKRFQEEFGFIRCQDLKDNWVGKPGQETCADLSKRTSEILIDLLENS